jgi:hypothetical protein
MIDALELAIPPDWELAPRWRFIPRLPDAEAGYPVKTHKTIDLRWFGVNATMHSHRGRGRVYDKLAFRSTGSMHYTEMQNVLHNLFDRDPANLRVSRIDLAVDLENITVDFFYRNAIAPRKHFSREFGRYTPSGTVAIETVYMGRRPNCFRIYSRTAKRMAAGETSSVPFCELVRIEREMGGAGVPESIRTVGSINNVLSLDAFSSLKIITMRDSDERSKTVLEWLAARGLRELLRERGAQQTIRILNKYSNRNAARLRRNLGIEECSITASVPDLNDRFRRSLQRQLGPAIHGLQKEDQANKATEGSDPHE